MILLWLSGAWLAGIGAWAMYGRDGWPVALAIGAALMAAALVRRSRRYAICALLLPAIFALAMFHSNRAEPRLAGDAVAHYNDGVAMRVRGVLRDDPEIRDTSQRFAVSVREVELRGEWQRASGGVLVHTGLLPSYTSGDIVEMEGTLESPPNLEGFDYAEYLARRDISSVLAFPRVQVVGHADDHWYEAARLAVRRKLSHGIALSLPEPHASVAQGVLLGERSALPAHVLDDLNATNTSHLVVVSGQNVLLVSAFTAALLGVVLDRRRAMLLSLLVVAAYVFLVGFSPPVLRAGVMGALLVIAGVSGRRTHGLTSLAAAAAAMTALQPSTIGDVSFQLSFAATAGIMYVSGPLRARIVDGIGWALGREEVPRWLNGLVAEPAAITIAATIATTPLLMMNFGRFSLVGLPANVLIVPAFVAILFSSLIAAVGGLLPGVHLVLGAPAYVLVSYWLAVCRWLAGLPGATASIDGYSSTWAILSYTAMLAIAPIVLRWLNTPRFELRTLARPIHVGRIVRVAAAGVPCVALAVFAIGALSSEPARLQVTVMDVGQGDAILIETPSGVTVLVDGGPGRAVLRGLGDELSYRDRTIDLMIMTHPQADHAYGLLDVLARYDVRRVHADTRRASPALAYAWSEALAAEGIAAEPSRVGQTFDLGDGVLLEVLAPGDATIASASTNDNATVVRLQYGDVSFLLTGDIEAAGETALLDRGIDLGATVLKVAHHGSSTSTSAAFLAAVQPSVAVISAGRDNSFGHPRADVIARLGAYADVYTTAGVGSVRIRTDGARLWIDHD